MWTQFWPYITGMFNRNKDFYFMSNCIARFDLWW
jgi:hypothetical protein